MNKIEQTRQNRNKMTGQFGPKRNDESEVTLFAVGREGVPVGHREKPPKQKYTHAVIAEADTAELFRSRALKSINEDKEVLKLLDEARDEEPAIYSYGDHRAGMISISPPRRLRSVIEPVRTERQHVTQGMSLYKTLLEQEVSATKARIQQTEVNLELLEEGKVELELASVLRWTISFDLARRHVASSRLRDKVGPSRIFIGRVYESSSASAVVA